MHPILLHTDSFEAQAMTFFYLILYKIVTLTIKGIVELISQLLQQNKTHIMLTNKGVALKNSRHFATPSKVSSRNYVTLRGNVGSFAKYQLFKSG